VNRPALFFYTCFAVGVSGGACETSDSSSGGAGGTAGTMSGGSVGTSGGAGGTSTGGTSTGGTGTGGARTGGAGGTATGGAGGAIGGSGGKTGGNGGFGNSGGIPGDSCNDLAPQGDWIETKSIPASPGFIGGTVVPGLYYLTSAEVIDGSSPTLLRWTIRITPAPNSTMEWAVEDKSSDPTDPSGIAKAKFNATYITDGKKFTWTRTCNPSGRTNNWVYTATGNTLTLAFSSFVYTLTRQP